ncbi:hypothetical protein GCK32_021617, partial [Trichostrongylus colubriformis]
MKEIGFVQVASAFAALSTAVLLATIASLIRDINVLHDEVKFHSSEYRQQTDAAWTALMDLQPRLFPLKPRHELLTSIFRPKRQTSNQLPAWCQCEVTRPVCAPGPPGPTGPKGTRGPRGQPGRRGSDNYE